MVCNVNIYTQYQQQYYVCVQLVFYYDFKRHFRSFCGWFVFTLFEHLKSYFALSYCIFNIFNITLKYFELLFLDIQNATGRNEDGLDRHQFSPYVVRTSFYFKPCAHRLRTTITPAGTYFICIQTTFLMRMLYGYRHQRRTFIPKAAQKNGVEQAPLNLDDSDCMSLYTLCHENILQAAL
ncbi:Hypothetical_protein [Hexamita inflata]|uniref:Hypothetical_protein n=1 Tax=Hexamita inflata TaxID=28002 RepID=A0AA86UTU8_9EUKA|nr:Hypothetical protein HINF_LOCUS59160 [Hexamita inflata]